MLTNFLIDKYIKGQEMLDYRPLYPIKYPKEYEIISIIPRRKIKNSKLINERPNKSVQLKNEIQNFFWRNRRSMKWLPFSDYTPTPCRWKLCASFSGYSNY